ALPPRLGRGREAGGDHPYAGDTAVRHPSRPHRSSPHEARTTTGRRSPGAGGQERNEGRLRSPRPPRGHVREPYRNRLQTLVRGVHRGGDRAEHPARRTPHTARTGTANATAQTLSRKPPRAWRGWVHLRPPTDPSVTAAPWVRAVHPHVRGACGVVEIGVDQDRGPSPRAWGLLPRPRCGMAHLRSIPTCVGPALTGALKLAAGSVHPHVRGACPPLLCQCSPRAVHPHVRGACTPRCAEAGSRPGLSPRAWGLPALALPVLDEGGPSPRAWGLRRGTAVRALDMRSIPTCVGPALNDLQRRAALSFLN